MDSSRSWILFRGSGDLVTTSTELESKSFLDCESGLLASGVLSRRETWLLGEWLRGEEILEAEMALCTRLRDSEAFNGALAKGEASFLAGTFFMVTIL